MLRRRCHLNAGYQSLISALAALALGLPALSAKPLSLASSPQKVVHAAESSLGKEMWKGYGLKTGYLGCAAALCNVLKDADITAAHSAAVVVARQQLLESKLFDEIVVRNGPKESLANETLLRLAKPGDVLLAFAKPPENNFNAGGNAHCGILSTSTEICTNDWNDGIWKRLNVHVMFDSYPYVRLLRLKK